MFTKIILLGLLTTGVIGTSAASGIAPSSIEFAAGPVRLASGNGKLFNASMADHSPVSITVKLQSGSQLQIKF